ncbi:MAG: transcriptional regulator [Candidatus Nanoarchaeia archaeon]
MYLLPQEIEVWYIIPSIRKALAKELIKKYELSYEKAGNALGVSKAAIAQYLSGKRATKVKISKNIRDEIKISARKIAKQPKEAVREIEKILQLMKKEKCSCQVCKKYNKAIMDYCNCQPIY